ncbi:hypothetical protein GCM10029963_72290 [Micromonospora andamanensis]
MSDAGLLVAASLGQRLGLPGLLREHVTVPGSLGAHPDDKCLTVIHSLLAGGDCIDDVAALRAGSTQVVLGHRVAAPSTVGSFLRAFGFNHARQLDVVARRLLARAVAVGASPGLSESVTVDIDSTLCETFGLGKAGAREVMRTGRRGYHPLLAVIAGTGDVAHARLRRGRSNDATAAPVFIKETIGRLRAAGAAGELVLRMDSGFYLHDVVAACRAARVRFSIGARMIGNLKHVIPAIDEAAWTPIDYFLPGAAVTEICWTPFTQDTRGHDRPDPLPVRLIVRRTPAPTRWPATPAAPASRPCSPSTTTTRSSPTATGRCWTWKPTTAATPRSNWPSATSNTAWALRICRPKASAATPPGWS